MPKRKELIKKSEPKIPKALQKILANAPKEAPPNNNGIATVLAAKGIGSVSMEIGAGETPALISISNSGNATQISLSTPFGRPPIVKGEEPPPLLTPEENEPLSEPKINSSQFDQAWAQVAATAPKIPAIAPQLPQEELLEPEAPNSFDGTFELPEEPIEDRQEPIEQIVGDDAIYPEGYSNIQDIQAILEECAELRKQNVQLREQLSSRVVPSEGIAEAEEELRSSRARTPEVDGLQGKHGPVAKGADAVPVDSENSGSPALNLPKWEGKDLRILFPCHKITNPATAMMLVALALDFGAEKIGFIPGLGDARIANTRNRMAHLFLESGATWCLSIDDDIIPPVGRPQFTRDFIGATPEEIPDSLLNVHVVKRLMEAKKHLIGATYFGRRKYAPAMFKEGITDATAYNHAKKHSGAILPTEWVATGCMLVHKDVFEGIKKTSPELAPTGNRKHWDFFQEGKGEEEGEDVMFCRRAKKAGFQPFVDTGCQCYHLGYASYGFHNTENLLLGRSPNQTREGKWW